MSEEMPRISDERLRALRAIVACSVKGRGVYLEAEWADDLASVLRELEETRAAAAVQTASTPDWDQLRPIFDAATASMRPVFDAALAFVGACEDVEPCPTYELYVALRDAVIQAASERHEQT